MAPTLSLPLREPEPVFGPPVIRVYDEERLEEDIARIRTIKAADAITGGLSKPSKMPGYAYSIPAEECKVGGRLQAVRGSVCHRCYALTNRYGHETVKAALRRRFEGIFREDWTPAMVLTLRKRDVHHFRWHDSGDVQNVEHLLNIATIARCTPETRHWLPTREIEMVRAALAELTAFPENLTVRVSAHMIDAPPPAGFPNTSTVTASRPRRGSYACPAPDQGNRCGKCRACWDADVRDVSYWLH